MEPNPSGSEPALREELRRRRAQLRGSMSALEHALAQPAPGDPRAWVARVHEALVGLSADFGEHIDITEGPDGLYRELLSTAPRLSDPVRRLTEEHGVIRGLIDALETRLDPADAGPDIDGARDLGTSLIGTLIRHRQRGSDLLYTAYEVEIGGET